MFAKMCRRGGVDEGVCCVDFLDVFSSTSSDKESESNSALRSGIKYGEQRSHRNQTSYYTRTESNLPDLHGLASSTQRHRRYPPSCLRLRLMFSIYAVSVYCCSLVHPTGEEGPVFEARRLSYLRHSATIGCTRHPFAKICRHLRELYST